MKLLVALDDGHGMSTPGKRTPIIPELGRAIHENEFNRAVVDLIAQELEARGIEVILVAPTDADTSLSQRVKLANDRKANIYVSVHYNAFDGKFDDYNPEGFSAHYFPGSVQGRKLAEAILNQLKNGRPQRNRGLVESNFQVLRTTNMPAVLTENGFMDNKKEAMWMIDPSFVKEVAMEHVLGICDYLGVKELDPKAQGMAAVDKLHQLGRISNPVLWKKNIMNVPNLEHVFIGWLKEVK